MKSQHFKENDIRPDHLMAKARVLSLADAGRMLTRREEFEEVECPACDSANFDKKFEKLGLKYVTCRECETMYINPRPSKKVLSWFYEGSVLYPYWNQTIFPEAEGARREKIFIPRVDRLLDLCVKYNVSTESLLEVGPGFGTFCTEMKTRNRFKRITGIEPTPSLAQKCRDRGIEVIEKSIEDVNFNEVEKFDVVATFEVIEHSFSPREFVKQCGNLLKPGGLFVATCPNGKGFDFVVLESLCGNVDHEHLNYFNPKSLSLLLKSCQFEVLEMLTPGLLDAELVRNKILAGELDVSRNAFLKQVLVDEWTKIGEEFQTFLSKNGLSSSMWVVARKL